MSITDRALRSVVSHLRARLKHPPGPREPATLLERGITTIGRWSYVKVPTVRYYAGDTASVRIGSFCSIADAVQFMPGGNHRTDGPSSYPFRHQFGLDEPTRNGIPWSKGDIILGNDVWIGRNALILGGVSIGDGAVVGAGSVVTRDVAPYEIVAGNPAEPRGRRMSVQQATAMQAIAWWEWADDLLAQRADELEGSDVDAFIAKYGR